MYQRSELASLIYNDPVAYADLILNGDPEAYLKTVNEYKPLDSWPYAARGRNPTGGIYFYNSENTENMGLCGADPERRSEGISGNRDRV